MKASEVEKKVQIEKVKKHEIEMDKMNANIEKFCKNREVEETKRKDIMELWGRRVF